MSLRELMHDRAAAEVAPRVAGHQAADMAWGKAVRRRRSVRVAGSALAVAGLTALLVLSVVLAPVVRPPQPAAPPAGPGALPSRVWTPPSSTPLVTEHPIARAAYVLSAPDVRTGTFSHGQAPVLVSADGGGYRVLPLDLQVDDRLSLSPDGRQVAWAHSLTHLAALGPDAAVVRVMTLADGRVRTVRLPVQGGPQIAYVGGSTWSSDGKRVLVWGGDVTAVHENDFSAVQRVWEIDAGTGTVRQVGEGRGPVAEADHRLVTMDDMGGEPGPEAISTVGTSPRLVLSPDGREAVWRSAEVPSADGTPATRSVLRVVAVGGAEARDVRMDRAGWAGAQVWTRQGVVITLGPDPAGRDGGDYAQVVVVDPVTGRTVRGVTRGPGDAATAYPIVELVAADIAAGGRVRDTPEPTGATSLADHVRSWLAHWRSSGALLALLLLVTVVLVVALSPRSGRRPAPS